MPPAHSTSNPPSAEMYPGHPLMTPLLPLPPEMQGVITIRVNPTDFGNAKQREGAVAGYFLKEHNLDTEFVGGRGPLRTIVLVPRGQ